MNTEGPPSRGSGVIHHWWEVLWCLLLAIGMLGVTATAQPAAAATTPTLQLSTTALVPGETTTFEGAGWKPNTVFQASVCGARAVNGSEDCDVTSSMTFAANLNGVISAALVVVVPPKPCPCVVLVTGPQNENRRTFPVTIAGVPYSAVTAQPSVSRVVVERASLTGSVSPRQWFGLAVSRTLVLTLMNTGAAPTQSLHIYASLGLTPVASRHLAGLSPGRQRTYQIRVRIPALSVGRLTITGRVTNGVGNIDVVKVPATFFPFGLLIVLLILIQLVLLLIRNAVRRRSDARSSEALGSPDAEESAMDRLAVLAVPSGPPPE
jgi:hypothetical protein